MCAGKADSFRTYSRRHVLGRNSIVYRVQHTFFFTGDGFKLQHVQASELSGSWVVPGLIYIRLSAVQKRSFVFFLLFFFFILS